MLKTRLYKFSRSELLAILQVWLSEHENFSVGSDNDEFDLVFHPDSKALTFVVKPVTDED